LFRNFDSSTRITFLRSGQRTDGGHGTFDKVRRYRGRCREKGVLLNCTSESVLRFVPPLTITKQQLDTGGVGAE